MKQPPLPPEDKPPAGLSEASLSYLSGRGIPGGVAKAAGLVNREHMGVTYIGFPYLDEKGEVQAYKYRSAGEKKFFCKGAPSSFFMQPQSTFSGTLIITEGEIDALSCIQAGLSAMSVPNGAPSRVTEGKVDPSEDGKFRYVWGAKDLFKSADKVVLLTDADIPGQALAEELARRIGKGKCWRVDMPADCKDANDVLVKLGAQALRDLISSAQPWPIEGVYDALHYQAQLSNLFHNKFPPGHSTGYSSIDELYTVVPGHLCLVTGSPGSGKTAWLNQIMVNMATQLNWRFAVQSTEIDPATHIAMLCAIKTGKPFFSPPFNPTPKMTEDEFNQALDWVNNHFTFLEADGSPDIEGTLERLELAVMRFGCRGVVIDPASYLRSRASASLDVDSTGFMLEDFKRFAVQSECAVWLVAHPKKPLMNGDAPTGYSVSGSAHWFNRPDMGITIHRPKEDRSITEVHVWKVRYGWTGKEGRAELFFDVPTGVYSEQPQLPMNRQVVYSAYSPSERTALDDFLSEF